MKILLVNTLNTGGAAKACIRLHQGLLKKSIASKLLLKEKTSRDIPETYQFANPKKVKNNIIPNRIRKYLTDNRKPNNQKELEFIKSRSPLLEVFSYPFSKIDITENTLYKESDIVHLHWVANFLDYPSFFQKNKKPVVWTLHDANPFLGGEHYAERFCGIDDRGYPISRKYAKREMTESERLIKEKRDTLQSVTNLHVVCPSRWLQNESENSYLFHKFPHHNIPYGYPTEIFKPLDKKYSRYLLGIPNNKFVILFVSESLTNFRKGYVFLKRSIENLSPKYKDGVLLCAIGGNNSFNNVDHTLELGPINDDRLMAIAYSAADIFVIPSLEDNLPNTMIESLLCGTPVIGFPTGGIAETIIDSFNGFLCQEISVSCLQKMIEEAILKGTLFNRGSISEDASRKFNLLGQANKYISLYESIINFDE